MLYKVLNEDGTCCNGGVGAWHLPGKQPDGLWKPFGQWMPKITGNLVPCSIGYHLCREEDLVHWLGPAIWEVEAKGRVVTDTDKVVVREARLLHRVSTWSERTARLFAADCAEHVLHLFEEEYPNDNRPRKAIEAARLYANDTIGVAARDAAGAAAGAAGWDAARDAARVAAGAAAGAAGWAAAGEAARDAARAAAGAAARAAAGAAARDAAGDAARAAGWAAAGATARDAAWAAARDAARDAAGDAGLAAGWAAGWAARGATARDTALTAAWVAAWTAAGAAAGEAARDAARDTAGEWQTARLMSYLRGERP